MLNPQSLIRPLVRELHPYVYGEQPKVKGLIKLNTNENPYPPSPKVLAAVKAAVDGRLRLYPNPTAQVLRERLAKLHGCKADNIIAGNGSDELLALATRALVEPSSSNSRFKAPAAESLVQYFTPSYSLYPVLADIHGAGKNPVPLKPDFGLPGAAELKREGIWRFDAALTYVTTPNAPSGRGYSTAELESLCRAQRGVVVLDEAYVDFAEENALRLALEYSARARCPDLFQGVFAVLSARGLFCRPWGADHRAAQDPRQLQRKRPGPGGRNGDAARLRYYRTNFKKIVATRDWLSRELTKLGFRVFPSRTNFILARPPAALPQSGSAACASGKSWCAGLICRR